MFVAADRNNDPWITTSSGRAYYLSGGKWSDETEALGKKPGVVGAMVDDQAGNVWFGFSNKVVRWDGSSPTRDFVSRRQARRVGEYHVGSGRPRLAGRSRRRPIVHAGPVLSDAMERSGICRAGYLALWKLRRGDLWVNGFSGISACLRLRIEEMAQRSGLRGFRGAPGRTGWASRALGRKTARAIGSGSGRRTIVVCDDQGHRMAGSGGAAAQTEIACRRR